MVLSASDLASIEATLAEFLPQAQALAEALLPDVCTIQRATELDREVVCRVQPNGTGDREKTTGDRLITVNSWTIALPSDTDVVVTDTIVYQGSDFEILAVQGPRSFETERIVIARRLPL